MAHDRGCGGELAAALATQLAVGSLPNLAALRRQFAPTAAITVPDIVVALPPIASYDALLPQTATRATMSVPTLMALGATA